MQNRAEIPLAIVGMACRLPGADNLEEFWSLLAEGRSQLGQLPPERFDPELRYHPEKGHRTKSYASIGGIVPPTPFDHKNCPIPQRLLDESHDVHLRLCEVAAAACRHAGLDPFEMPPLDVGVYIGHTPPSAMSGDLVYARLIEQTAEYLREVPGFNDLTGGAQDSVIREIVERVRAPYHPGDKQLKMRANAYHAASVISEGFGLHGPAMCFDAACASSMRALGHAARALQLGRIDMAIVGSASYCHSDILVLFSQAQSVSANKGTCPFDNDADGLVASEGYVVLAIKTLERALADGDPIQSIIRRVGISSDGKGKSLWAPRAEGQIEAIRRAYGPGLSLDDLQYIEMHATSTQVGDATEIDALSRVLKDALPPGKKVPVGSVKANVGHTLESAGLTSVLKTVLAMQNAAIPPQINIKRLNEKIDWDNVPFYVPQTKTDWPSPSAGAPRCAAVNAFGIGGLNVHIVLNEHLPEVSKTFIAPPAAPALSDSRETGEEAVAIIGMGAVLPGARTIDAVWDAISAGGDQKSPVPPERWDSRLGYEADNNQLWRVPTRMGGFIRDFEYDWKRHKVPPKQIASADPLQFMLLDAVDQAFQNAGLDRREYDKSRTGVIVGTIFSGEFAHQLSVGLRLPDFQVLLADILRRRGVPEDSIADVSRQYEDILLKHMPALIDETGSFTASTLASRITKTFDLMGGAVAVDSGDTSSMSALASAIDVLVAGDCDMMLCAAGHRAMGLANYESMAKLDLLSKTDEPRGPFDAETTGCVPGEGVGVVILKRLSDAQRDGDTIHGVIRGISARRDGDVRNGVEQSTSRALAAAGVAPEEVAVIEAGATGIPEIDAHELSGLASAYSAGSRGDDLRIGALAGQIGNTGAASGMLELIKAVEELNHAEIPPNVGPARPADIVQQHADQLRLAAQAAPVRVANASRHGVAGISSISQFNLAYHLIVEGAAKIPAARISTSDKPQPCADAKIPAANIEQPSAARPAAATEAAPLSSAYRIVRIAADSLEALADRAKQAASESAALYAAAVETPFQPGDRYRLAIVTESPDDLSAKLTLAAAQITRPEARKLLGEKGIFHGQAGARRPLVGFVFPGQGSQYDGMLQSLVAEFPPAAAALAEVDAVLSRLKLPSFAELAWQPGNGLGTDVWRTQLSLLAADTIVYAAATALGLKADRVAGHSFGELVALTAAGAWTFDEAVLATRARCAAIDACEGENGTLVSTSAPAEVLESLCRQVEGRVSISHQNAPEQTVAGGDEAAVHQLAQLAARQGYTTKILDVPAAFHTPLMEEVKAPFGKALAGIPLQPPRIPLLSSVTNKYVADPEDIRENLVVQMTQPVYWRDLALRLADEGISVLVEVGPRQVLTGLNRQTLADRDVALVGCDHPKRTGLVQLLHARACVETTGALDPEPQAPLVRTSHPSAATSSQPTAASAADKPDDAPATFTAHHQGLNILPLSGTPYEMGFQHGRAQQQEIRAVLRRYADLAGSPWEKLFRLDEAVAQPETFFGGDELEELRGIAKGADVTLAGVIAHNLRLFYDAEAGGVHFALSAGMNPGTGLLHAANEDLPRSVRLSDCLARNIQIRRPEGALPHVTFGAAGQIGSLNGINARGLAVSTATLADVPRDFVPRNGRLYTVLVKQILQQATDVDSAVDIIRQARVTGTWGLCISHYVEDRVCYVEYDGANLKVQPAAPIVLAANHRLLYHFAREIPPHSERRLNRLKELLGGDRPQNVSLSQVQAALRDRFDRTRGRELDAPTINTVRRVDNQISVVMQPGEGNLWITGGPLTNGHQNQFTQLKLTDLLPELPPLNGSAAETRGETAANSVSAEMEQPTAKKTSAVVSADAVAKAYAASEAADNGADTSTVCSRFVMRLVEVPPLSGSPAPKLNGAALILGDNPAAQALRQHLEQLGTRADVLAVGGDVDETLSRFETMWNQSQPLHLFLMTPHDADAVTALDADHWNRRRTRGVEIPYAVCQRWYERVAAAGRLEQASLVAAGSMGGDFGFSGGLTNVESGALAGLLKGVAMELQMQVRVAGFRTKIVDTAGTISPAELAVNLLKELAAGDGQIEVGYLDGRRHLPRPVVEPAAAREAAAEIPPGATFVITGGARGVTAVVARELGTRYGANLHLIGSSPIPDVPETYLTLSDEELKELRGTVMKEALANGEKPLDAWGRFEKSLEIARTLRSFADAGIRAVYYSCDISDRAALAALLETIRAADGPITGIIHGAGFERACRFEKKERALVGRTIAAKVDGAAALMELTRQDSIRYFAGFGSVSGRFGGVGQTDYCLANDMLAKLIDWYRGQRPDCAATIFHWHAWDDVGMAVRPESKHIAKLHNIAFMPSLEGVDHLLEEMRRGLPEGEIVVTELKYCRELYGDTAAAPNAGGEPAVDALPLIDALPTRDGDRQLTAELQLDPTRDLFLVQHRYKGRPMLPVVITLEAVAEAAALLAGGGQQVSALKNIEILNGLKFLGDNPLTARLSAARTPEGIACELSADFVNRGGKVLRPDQPYLRCLAEIADSPAVPVHNMPQPPAEWTDCWYPEEDLVIYHGPVFRTLRQSTTRDRDFWARLVAPPVGDLAGQRSSSGWLLPPALLDGCFFASGIFLWLLLEGVVAIPAGIERLVVGRQARPGEECIAHIHYRGREENQGIFDFVLYGDDGTVILQVDGYHNVIVSEAPMNVR